jgi:hypothetical protein
MELQSRRTIAALFPMAEGDKMNYQTKYLEDNAITKKGTNFLKLFVCFITQIGCTILFLKLYRICYDYANVFSATEKAQLEEN